MTIKASSITRTDNVVTIRPGPGAWSSEVDWTARPATTTGEREWVADITDADGWVAYTLRVADAGSSEFGSRLSTCRIEARQGGLVGGEPIHAVLVVGEWGPVASLYVDDADLLDAAAQTIRTSHHWVSLILRMSASMSRFDAMQLHLTDLDAMLDYMVCPALGLIGRSPVPACCAPNDVPVSRR